MEDKMTMVYTKYVVADLRKKLFSMNSDLESLMNAIQAKSL
jgi:hypothetical protein